MPRLLMTVPEAADALAVERRGGFLRFWPFPALVMARESAAWAAWLAAAPCR